MPRNVTIANLVTSDESRLPLLLLLRPPSLPGFPALLRQLLLVDAL